MNILITSAGQRVSLIRAFKQEVRKFQPGTKVFATDMVPQLSPACQVSDQYFRVPPVTEPSYMDVLLQLCRQQSVGMIVPTIDTELCLLAANKHRFKTEGVHVIVSSQELIGQFRDKRNTNSFFQQRGIRVPALIDKHQPRFPLFVKPYDGSRSAGASVIQSADELTAAYLQNEKLLFMEYLGKEDYDEYTVDMYYDKTGHLKCAVPRKRIFVRAGEVNKGVTSKNGLVSFLVDKLEFIEGAAGCLTAQFFLHKATGEVTGIEINGRFGGGYPLSYLAGANYPQWLLKEYFNNDPIPYFDDWEDQLLMLRYDDEILVHGHRD